MMARPTMVPLTLRHLLGEPLLWLLIAILVLGATTTPYFLTPLNVTNLLRNASIVGLLATGFSVALLTGRIDLSVAATMVASMIAGILVTAEIGHLLGERWMVRGNTFAGSPYIAMVLTLVAGALIGLINGLGVAALRIASFIMTLVTMSALRGVSYLFTGGAPIYYSDGPFLWIGEAAPLGLPIGFLVFLAVLLFLNWMLTRTVIGGRIYAVGSNEVATNYAGVHTGRVVVAVFVISGACSALAGILFTSRLMSVEPALAQGYELIAITIGVIGGISLTGGQGSLLRVLLAAVTFSAGLNILAIWGVATWYQNLVVGVALIATVALSRRANRHLGQ